MLSLANIHLTFADGTGDLSEHLGLLSALRTEEPDIGDVFDPDEAELPFAQTM